MVEPTGSALVCPPRAARRRAWQRRDPAGPGRAAAATHRPPVRRRLRANGAAGRPKLIEQHAAEAGPRRDRGHLVHLPLQRRDERRAALRQPRYRLASACPASATIWDRTAGRRSEVKGLCGLNLAPLALVTRDPAVHGHCRLPAGDEDRAAGGQGLEPGDLPADGGGQAVGPGRIRAARPADGVDEPPGRGRGTALGRRDHQLFRRRRPSRSAR